MAELLAAGHPYAVVMEEYSVDELQLHYEALLRRRAKETKRLAMAVRAGSQAGKRGWQEYMKYLDGTWRQIEVAAGRKPHNMGAFFAGLAKVKSKQK